MTDKTGTLTQNKMTVTRIWHAHKDHTIGGQSTPAFADDWKDVVQDCVQVSER